MFIIELLEYLGKGFLWVRRGFVILRVISRRLKFLTPHKASFMRGMPPFFISLVDMRGLEAPWCHPRCRNGKTEATSCKVCS